MTTLGVAGSAAPSAVPVAALVASAVAAVVGAAWLLAAPGLLVGPPGAGAAVGLTHLFVILCVSMAFVGTLQQLPAVLLVTDLAWRNVGVVAVPLLGVGGVVLVISFAAGFSPVGMAVGGAAVGAALTVTAAQTVATALRRPPRDPATRALVAATCYLAAATLLGFGLAAARADPDVATMIGYRPGLHRYAGLFGAFLLGIAAAGHKLLGMFALAKGGAGGGMRACATLVHLAMAASAAGSLTTRWGWPTAALEAASLVALCLAAGAHVLDVWAVLLRRLRRRLEAPVERYVLAHAFLPLSFALLVAGEHAAAAVSFLLGFVGLAVSGMLVKILSFLSWTTANGGHGPPLGRAEGGPTLGTRGPAAHPRLLRDLVRPSLEGPTTLGLGLGAVMATFAVATDSVGAAGAAATLLLVGALAQFAQAVTIVLRASPLATGYPRAPMAAK